MQLWRVQGDGSGLAPFAAVGQANCTETHYRQPAALTGATFAVLKICNTDNSSSVAIVTKDAVTGGETVLVPATTADVTEFSWNPKQSLGVVDNAGPTPCPQLSWAGATGIRPVDVAVKDATGEWHLNSGTGACPGSSRAQTPQWSPDGTSFAVFASAVPANNGVLRPADPWSLYFVDVAAKRAAPKLDGVVYPGGLGWSSDGRQLAFSADSYKGSGPGVWVVDVSTNKVTMVAKQKLGSLSWSPDGRKVAGVSRQEGDSSVRYSLVVLDLAGG